MARRGLGSEYVRSVVDSISGLSRLSSVLLSCGQTGEAVNMLVLQFEVLRGFLSVRDDSLGGDFSAGAALPPAVDSPA